MARHLIRRATLFATLLGTVATLAPARERTVFGIDVSHWQGTITWSSVHNTAGKVFAFCKATQGTTYTDPTFATNMTNGRAAGIYMGAYHFAEPTNAVPVQEAQHFVTVIQPYLRAGYLRPVLDLESGSSLGRTALTDWVLSFCQEVTTETGLRPLIYTNTNYATNYLDSRATVYDLWLANYTTGDPTSNPGDGVWSDFWFYQYSSTGSVSGVSGNCDLDVFNGTPWQFQSFVIQPTGITLR